MASNEIDLTKSNDNAKGTSGSDVFSTWMSKFSSNDTISGGSGNDVLQTLNGSVTLDPSYFKNVSGIDELYLSNAASKIVLTVDDDMVRQSDKGVLRVQFGSNEVHRLDTSGVSSADSLILDGTGPISLSDKNNQFRVGDGGATVRGGSGADRIIGGAGNDVMYGGADNDAFYGNRGNDLLEGGSGNDRLEGQDGKDTLAGGAGNDVLAGGSGADTFIVEFAEGNDIITDFNADEGDRLVLRGFNTIRSFGDIATTQTSGGVLLDLGGVGSVKMAGRSASDVENAVQIESPAADPVFAKLSGGTDTLAGGAGDDVFSAYMSAFDDGDVIRAGVGLDTLKILSGNYTLETANLPTISGVDVLDVTSASTPKLFIEQSFVDQSDLGVLTIKHGGIYRLDTSRVDDASGVVLDGRSGVTLVDGVDNRVTIGDGGGKVYGGSGNDVIIGGSGADLIVGGAGVDELSGGLGGDTLRGDDGADLFIIQSGATSVTIEDFDTNSAIEKVDLTALGLSGFDDLTIKGVSGGSLVSAGNVQIRLSGVDPDALDASDFILAEADRSPSHIRFESGSSVEEIQATIRHAPAGAVIELGAGDFNFDSTLYIDRPDIELRGAGAGETRIVFHLDGGSEKNGIVVGENVHPEPARVELKAHAKAGDTEVAVKDPGKFESGDFVYYSQKNDAAFFEKQGYGNLDPDGSSPLREGMARVEQISGNFLSLDRAVNFDLASNEATVTRIDLLGGIEIHGLQLAFDLGKPDLYDFSNTKLAFESAGALKVQNTHGASVSDISVVDAPSNAIWFSRALDLEADKLHVNGAHNKGGEGNGYGIILDEVSDSSITDITALEMRHSVLFGAWNSEFRNNIHVKLTDRDINFHGGPDAGNVVTVDKSEANYSTKSWTIVSRGGEFIHPPTNLDENAVYFREAYAGELNDFMHGHNDGSRLSGGGGNDTITGGIGQDVISGDRGNDRLDGSAGADRFIYRNGDGLDTIYGFDAGEGDVLELRGFAINTLDGSSARTSGSDLILGLGGSHGIILKGLAGTKVEDIPVEFGSDLEGSVAGVVRSSSGDTSVLMGSTGDDTFSAYISHLDENSEIVGGAGIDTLHFKSGSFTFDSRKFPGIQGVDRIDLTDTTAPKFFIDSDLVDASDNNMLVLQVGSKGMERLETSDMPKGMKVVIDGPGRVKLGSDGAEIELSDNGSHYIAGDKGDDFVRSGQGSDRIELGGGNDTLIAGGGDDTLAGGSGADTFIFEKGSGHNVIKDWSSDDHIVFEGFDAGASFHALVVDEGLLLSLPGDQSVLLAGVDSKIVSSSDVDWV